VEEVVGTYLGHNPYSVSQEDWLKEKADEKERTRVPSMNEFEFGYVTLNPMYRRYLPPSLTVDEIEDARMGRIYGILGQEEWLEEQEV
jgi:hypothetical protein